MWDWIKKSYGWLEGKKRRIALLTALAANYVDDPIAKPILLGITILLGGADALGNYQKNKNKKA